MRQNNYPSMVIGRKYKMACNKFLRGYYFNLKSLYAL